MLSWLGNLGQPPQSMTQDLPEIDPWIEFKNHDRKNKDSIWHENQIKSNNEGWIWKKKSIKKINETEGNYNKKNED